MDKFSKYNCTGKRPYWLEVEELGDWMNINVLITIWTPINCNTGAIGLSFNENLAMPYSINWEPGKSKHFSTSYVALGTYSSDEKVVKTMMRKSFKMQ